MPASFPASSSDRASSVRAEPTKTMPTSAGPQRALGTVVRVESPFPRFRAAGLSSVRRQGRAGDASSGRPDQPCCRRRLDPDAAGLLTAAPATRCRRCGRDQHLAKDHAATGGANDRRRGAVARSPRAPRTPRPRRRPAPAHKVPRCRGQRGAQDETTVAGPTTIMAGPSLGRARRGAGPRARQGREPQDLAGSQDRAVDDRTTPPGAEPELARGEP